MGSAGQGADPETAEDPIAEDLPGRMHQPADKAPPTPTKGWTTLGRYRVLGTLGQGGMGTALRAFDPQLDRMVALKVLHKGLGSMHTTRLRREAQALAKLSHPNVVQVYEVGEFEGQTFVAMELVKGQTLRSWMRQSPRPSWRACVEVFLQVGMGLAAAHERGLVHRDFKPSNAMIDPKGRVRVLDFGLARQVDDADVHDSMVQRGRDDEIDAHLLDASLTRTGTVLGTPAYMPLEQMLGTHADARSDQFSFCVALYEAVYGQRPYLGRSMASLMFQMSAGSIEPLTQRVKIPARLRKVLERGLAQQPEERWPSMQELLAELRQVLRSSRRSRRKLGLELVLITLGVTLGGQAIPEPECEHGAQPLAGIWDDVRRAEVERTILGSGQPYATQTLSRVEQVLDAYAYQWLEIHQELCEAAPEFDEIELERRNARQRCLERHREALGAVTRTLSHADLVPHNAIDVVDRLPSMPRCDDAEKLVTLTPDTPQKVTAVGELRTQMIELEAQLAQGDLAGALDGLDPVLREAQTLAYEPLLAEVERLHGQLLKHDGQYEIAKQVLTRAYNLAAKYEHHEVMLAAATSLAVVVGDRQAQPTEGLRWGQEAQALARLVGDDIGLAHSTSSLAKVRTRQGRYDEAERHLRDALALRREISGNEDPSIAYGLEDLGALLLRRGRYADAELQLREALRIHEASLGSEHPDLALSQTLLGEVRYRRGHYDDAKELLGLASRLRVQALGEDHPLVAETASVLGLVYHALRDGAQAERYHRRALDIREQRLGPDHPDLAISLKNLGLVFSSRGQLAEANQYFERARAILVRSIEHEHPLTAEGAHALGRLRWQQQRYEEAQQLLQRAVEIRRRVLGAKHPDVAESIAALGYVRWDQGQHKEAEALFRQTLDLRIRVLNTDHPQVSASHHHLGGLLITVGRYKEAEVELRRALELRERAFGVDHMDRANSANYLGISLERQGRYEEAKYYYQQALRTWERVLGEDVPRVAMVLSNLSNVLMNQGEYEAAEHGFERALRIFEHTRGPKHRLVAISSSHLGSALLYQGQYAAAQKHLERALALYETTQSPEDPEDPEIAKILNELGIVARHRGRRKRARRQHERALALQERVLGLDHPELTDSLNSLGDLFAESGQWAKARPYYERSLAIGKRMLESESVWSLEPLVGLAQVELAERDVHSARKHAERAVAISEEVVDDPELRAAAYFALARALWADNEQRERALELAERARATYAERAPASHEELTTTIAWLARRGHASRSQPAVAKRPK
ncbi:MAG: tetratricopeptide repeat protein [Myxococcota bacterium]